MRWSRRTSDIICSESQWDSVPASHHQETDHIPEELTHSRNGGKHRCLPSNYGGGERNRASVNAEVHAGTRKDYNNLKAQSLNLAKDSWHCRGFINTQGKFTLLLMPLNTRQLLSKRYTELGKFEPTLTWKATKGCFGLIWPHINRTYKYYFSHAQISHFDYFSFLCYTHKHRCLILNNTSWFIFG